LYILSLVIPLKNNFRVIDDEPEETEAEIALVVLKDGEKVSLGTPDEIH